MRKLPILFILSMVLAIAAHADILDECVDGALGGEGSNSPLCLPLIISTLPISPFISTTETSADNRAVYIQQVRDDAAEYVAANGQDAASALLLDAIHSIRAHYPRAQQLNDLQIATVLLN